MAFLGYLVSTIATIGRFLEDHSGAISAISTVFVAAFTYTLWRATTKLWKSSQRHAEHLESSLAQAGRSATAMEQVAESLVQTADSGKESTRIGGEIAERQRVVSELQSRAYLSVIVASIVPQNRATGYRFEPRMGLVNNGNTPAYNVSFRTAADVCPFPLPADFAFPLPDQLPSRSITIIGPRLNKILSAVVPRLYSEEEERAIRDGVAQRLYIWGVVTYTDAFNIERFVRFSQSFIWLSDGNVMGIDTTRHNDAN
jgi:hypothetical protein